MSSRLQAAAAATLQGSVRAASKSVAETSSAGSKRAIRVPSRVLVDGGSEDKLRRAEEALRTIMYLSCWWPN